MAEIRTQHEPALPAKRKPDPSFDNKGGGEEAEEYPNKSQKLEDDHTLESYTNSKSNEGEDGVIEGGDGEEKEEENENGEAVVVDRKGKGIMVNEDEGSDDEEDDNSSDDDVGSDFDGDDDDCSELEEDPLAEVDLDNILPSRTRRRVVQPGEFIDDNLGDDDDDDSDDSAA